jgi:hypothetical protein
MDSGGGNDSVSCCGRQPEHGCGAGHPLRPTEQEIHASDSGVPNGTPGRHPYRCDGNRALLIDFKDQGLTVELRSDARAAPIVLTAPSQGLQYVGDAQSATFSGNEIRIEAAGQRPVVCRKETRQ